MNRLPRKLKKRRKKAELERVVKEALTHVIGEALDKHYQETLHEIFPILKES